ncbi:MAG TPA: peptidoglycan DD-metalloendopeptidase family protein [Draconibacterium sp.]|nr:peptidoglycan DD-metalloendopeptidase family protein [Draconibacterium sp.]
MMITNRQIIQILFLVFIFAAQSCRQNQQKVITKSEVAVPEPVYRYGLPIDSFQVVDGIVESGQHLSSVLSKFGVNLGTIDTIARNAKPVFDVRKIRQGNKFAIFQTTDSTVKSKYFVYENSPILYTVFELFDSLQVYQGEKEVVYQMKTAQGEIQSSLWNAMKASKLDPMLALKMEEVYAWTVDFFGLQKGDRFRLIYDEIYVDSTSIGINNIYAAQFDFYGKELFAFRFEKNDSTGYYNEKGENLQKQFLKAPLKFSRISSGFSSGRMHPILRIVRPHHGVDYAAPTGTPVMSIGEGIVVSKGWAGGGGNTVKIRHNSVYTTVYMHLSRYADGINQGARVRQGQVIGFVGSTGLSTGPHLDFRVYKGGSAINPLTIESPPAKPVDEKYMQEYNILKDSLLRDLKKIEWKEKILAEAE